MTVLDRAPNDPEGFMSASEQWYVAVDDASVGPVSTELVTQGIEHRRIPLEALVCRVGASAWESLDSIEAFHAAVLRSYPPPPLESGPLPSFDDPPDARVGWSEARVSANDIEVDVDVGAPPAVDLTLAFHGYFFIGDAVELPAEPALLESLSSTPPEVFHHDEAMWNLALCLVFGSDAVGAAAARAFFDAVQVCGDRDRVAWMRRTLLDQGFVPAGIPASAGRRALERLGRACPPSLASLLRAAA
jgi:hypothetical protein